MTLLRMAPEAERRVKAMKREVRRAHQFESVAPGLEMASEIQDQAVAVFEVGNPAPSFAP